MTGRVRGEGVEMHVLRSIQGVGRPPSVAAVGVRDPEPYHSDSLKPVRKRYAASLQELNEGTVAALLIHGPGAIRKRS